MLSRRMIWMVVCLFSVQFAMAQDATLTGKVVSPTGEPMSEVQVGIKGTAHATKTQADGTFILTDLPVGNQTLIASHAGWQLVSRPVQLKSGANQFDLQFKKQVQEIDEMTIVKHGKSDYAVEDPSVSLRMKTPLLEAPQNIQVLTKQTLDDQQSFDMLESVGRNVSGAVKSPHWDNYANIQMRGARITPFRNGMNVNLSYWSPLTEDMSMVERIEFVKGPAGFMLGNGEPSGFYNVVTKKPTGKEGGAVSFSMGSFDLYRTTLDLDGKLSKDGKWLYRLNVMGQLKGSHRDFEFNNRYSIAPVIKYNIDEKSSFTLEYNEQFSQMSVIGSNYAFSANGFADLPVNFTTAEPNLDPTNMRDRSILAIFEHRFNEHWNITAQAAFLHFKQEGQSLWPWGISMSNDSLMQRGISIWDAMGYNKNAQVFLNGDFNTGPVRHRVLAGIDMSHRDYYADWNQGAALGDSTFNIYDPQYGTVAASAVPQWDRSQDIRERGVRYTNGYTGVYVQDELGFFDNKLRLTIAGRYTNIQYVNPYDGTYSREKVTPRAGLSWTILKNFTTYALYDQAFMANPGRDWEGNDFDPITGDNMEWGLKRDWFDGKWNTAVSVYQITKNNVLTTDLDHPDPVNGQFLYSKQTGQQQTRGVELDVRGTLFKNFNIVLNYAYLDSKITKDSDTSLVGRTTPGTIAHVQNTWLTYRIGSGKLEGLSFSAGYQYQGKRSGSYLYQGTTPTLPDYFRLDAGIGYQAKQFGIHLMVNNLLNEYLYDGAPYYGMYYWQTEAPRNFRLTLSYKF